MFLLGQHKKIMAVKLVREETGLGLKAAIDYCDAVAAGRVPRGAAALNGSLATRVRLLLDADDFDSAIRLVCRETGMNPREAERFIDALD
jgi:hypothetical protein